MTFSVALIFVGILTASFQFFSIDTYGVTLADAGIVSFYMVIAKKLLWDGERLTIPRAETMTFFVAFPVLALISGLAPLTSDDPPTQVQFLKTSTHFFYIWFVGFFCAALPFNPNIWKRTFQSWLLLSVPINVFGVYQIVARAFNLPFAWLDMNNMAFAMRGKDLADISQLSLQFESFYRATSIFSEPSGLSSFNSIVLALMLVPYLRKSPPFFRNTLLRYIIVICSIVGVFLTFSLTGLLLLSGMILFIILTEQGKHIGKLIRVGIISAVILFIADIAVENYASVSVTGLFVQRIGGIYSAMFGGSTETIVGESFFYRADNSLKAFDIWQHYPVTGVGIGCMYNYTKDPDQAFADSTIGQALADLGPGGMLAIIGLCAAALYRLYKISRPENLVSRSPEAQTLTLAALLLSVQMVFHIFTANMLVSVDFWLRFGLMISVIISAPMYAQHPSRTVTILPVPLRALIGRRAAELRSHT